MKHRFLLMLILIMMLAPLSSLSETGSVPVDQPLEPLYPVEDYVSYLLEVAASEVGYQEGEHGRSKYGEWAGDPYAQWCAEYLCWCVDQVDKLYGTNLLRNVYPLYSGTNTGRDWFIRNGRYVCRWGNVDNWGYQWLKGQDHFITTGSYIPEPGDWVFFTWTSNTDTDHVAMVEYSAIDQEGKIWIHVLEGNKPSRVERFAYELTNPRILGFGTVHDVMDITMRFGNEGEKVTQLQKKLHYLGLLEECYITGHFGNATQNAITIYQLDHGLKSNGIANMDTQRRIDADIEYKIDHDPVTWTVIDDDED